MAKENLTKSTDAQITARERDFVGRFAHNWEHLRNILGIMRPIRKQPGAVLKSKKATLVLADGKVAQDGARKDILPSLLGGTGSICSALTDKVR